MVMTTKRYALRDDQWQRIEHLLPGRVRIVGVTAKNKRLFVKVLSFWCRNSTPPWSATSTKIRMATTNVGFYNDCFFNLDALLYPRF
jgi:transposase